MRKATLIIGLVALIAVLALALSAPPSVTLTVQVLTNDSRVADLFPGSDFQSVVAIVEMKNNSQREFVYTAFLQCSSVPYFKCRYREAGVWREETLDTATDRAFAEYPVAITGNPWGRSLLNPGDTVIFKADILRPRTECRIGVEYWEHKPRKSWCQRLPAWMRKWLPETRGTFQAETRSISNGSNR
jgi:hypothetical protein